MSAPFVMNQVPGALPLIGHGIRFRFRPFQFLRDVRHHGDIAMVRLGPRTAYVVNHPGLIRDVLVSQMRDFTRGGGGQYEKTIPLLGYGIAFADAEDHRRYRRVIQPMFHRSHLPSHASAISDLATAMVESWKEGDTVNISDDFRVLTMVNAFKLMFSVDLNSTEAQELEKSLSIALGVITKRAMAPFGFAEKLPTPANRRFDRSVAQLRGMIRDVIVDRRRGGGDQDDLVKLLLAAQETGKEEGLTDVEVLDNAVTVLAGASHTSGSVLAFACHLLARHPEMDDRLWSELADVLGDRPVGFDDIAKLEYTMAVCKETVRLYSPGWVFTRTATRDTTLGDHRIPAGGLVVFSPYAVHHDPAFFPDPDTFDPDRWLPGQSGRISPEAFMPFVLGARRCAGEPYAMVEMPAILATVKRRWRLEPQYSGEVRMIAGLTLEPGPVLMKVTRHPGDSAS